MRLTSGVCPLADLLTSAEPHPRRGCGAGAGPADAQTSASPHASPKIYLCDTTADKVSRDTKQLLAESRFTPCAQKISVPARPISEGAAPCQYWLAPCPIYTHPARIYKKTKHFFLIQNVIAVFVFSDSRCKNACKMLADLCPCFHQSPKRPNFGRSHVKDFVSFAH